MSDIPKPLESKTLDSLDEMMPFVQVTGDLLKQFIAIARWANENRLESAYQEQELEKDSRKRHGEEWKRIKETLYWNHDKTQWQATKPEPLKEQP